MLFISNVGLFSNTVPDSVDTVDKTGKIEKETPNYGLYNLWKLDTLYSKYVSDRITPKWLSDNCFWYSYQNCKDVYWYFVNPLTGEKILLTKLSDIKNQAKLKDLVEFENINQQNIIIENNRTLANIEFDTTYYTYNFQDKSFNGPFVKNKVSEFEDFSRSPDGKYMVYTKGNNLFIAQTRNVAGTEKQISFDGIAKNRWGGQQTDDDNNSTEKIPCHVDWSPDGNHFAIYREDCRKVKELWVIDNLAKPRPKLITYESAMPGEPVPQNELWFYSTGKNEIIKINTEKWKDQILWDFEAPTLFWNDSSTKFYYIRRSRDFLNVDLCEVDVVTGKSSERIEEKMEDVVYLKKIVLLKKTENLIWWSMRDSWGHLYMLDSTNNLIQLTCGEYNVDEVVAIDENNKHIYFTAMGKEKDRNPYFRHLYKMDYYGRKISLLTPENADHKVQFSPDHSFFVDNFSRVDSLPRAVLRNSNGEKILNLEIADITNLISRGWCFPEQFSVKAADGITDLWGVMWRPFNFDPHKIYPVIVRTYPGKQFENIPWRFSSLREEISLAQLGFIVINFGNRGGTFERGFDYQKFGRGNLRDFAIADKKAGVINFAKKYPFIDINKVGIFGGSSGGFCALSALLLEPDFFKAGVSWAGPHDPSIYWNFWQERFNGVEMKQKNGNIEWMSHGSSNIELADRLKGDLLIIQGEMDNTVHPAHAARLVDALMKANKTFEYFVIPGVNHSDSEMYQYVFVENLIALFFAKHLLNNSSLKKELNI